MNHAELVKARNVRPGQWLQFDDGRELVIDVEHTMLGRHVSITTTVARHLMRDTDELLVYDPAPFYEVDESRTQDKVREMNSTVRVRPEPKPDPLVELRGWIVENADFVECHGEYCGRPSGLHYVDAADLLAKIDELANDLQPRDPGMTTGADGGRYHQRQQRSNQ
jgi:hypothetical protein